MEAEIQKIVDVTELLKEMAFLCAGKPFNIDNPKDVSKILFIDLKLPVQGVLNGKMTIRKSTRSKLTASSKQNLIHLLPIHPLPGIIIEYRRLLMLIEKTLNPLLESCKKAVVSKSDPAPKIKCTYQQLSTTGRITTTLPNLQSVPKPISINWYKILHLHKANSLQKRAKALGIDKNEEYVVTNFRSCFMASKGHVLVGADYRQLELRILTHFTLDSSLIDFFASDNQVDVFIKMASKWLNKSVESVTAMDRQQAKQISYGIIYGISAQGLSDQLSIDDTQAGFMIKEFMTAFPGVNKFIKMTIENCRKNGFVETICGRRRFLQDIDSDNVYTRSHAERQAVHSTIQGSAADIVKAAMVKVHRAVTTDFQDRYLHKKLANQIPSMVLHLHDELIYEVPENYASSMAAILKHNMEDAFHLKIPLPVKVKTGKTWSGLVDFDI